MSTLAGSCACDLTQQVCGKGCPIRFLTASTGASCLRDAPMAESLSSQPRPRRASRLAVGSLSLCITSKACSASLKNNPRNTRAHTHHTESGVQVEQAIKGTPSDSWLHCFVPPHILSTDRASRVTVASVPSVPTARLLVVCTFYSELKAREKRTTTGLLVKSRAKQRRGHGKQQPAPFDVRT